MSALALVAHAWGRRSAAPTASALPTSTGSRRRAWKPTQLERVFDLFPREQVLLIKYEDFRRDYARTINNVFAFLGVRRLTNIKNKEQNAGPYQRKITAEEREDVSALFDEETERLEKMLGWDCSDWRCSRKIAFAATK